MTGIVGPKGGATQAAKTIIAVTLAASRGSIRFMFSPCASWNDFAATFLCKQAMTDPPDQP
jgi:hypothetical protein